MKMEKTFSALVRHAELADFPVGHQPIFGPVREKCPYCGSPVVKFGRQARNNRQRYRCKNLDCLKCFVSSTGTAVYRSRLCLRRVFLLRRESHRHRVRRAARRRQEQRVPRSENIPGTVPEGRHRAGFIGENRNRQMIFTLVGDLGGKPAGRGVSNDSHQVSIGETTSTEKPLLETSERDTRPQMSFVPFGLSARPRTARSTTAVFPPITPPSRAPLSTRSGSNPPPLPPRRT